MIWVTLTVVEQSLQCLFDRSLNLKNSRTLKNLRKLLRLIEGHLDGR